MFLRRNHKLDFRAFVSSPQSPFNSPYIKECSCKVRQRDCSKPGDWGKCLIVINFGFLMKKQWGTLAELKPFYRLSASVLTLNTDLSLTVFLTAFHPFGRFINSHSIIISMGVNFILHCLIIWAVQCLS